jgi:CubicO group peptidase (beta-lactamase class C family)
MVTKTSVDKVLSGLDELIIERFNQNLPSGLAVGVVYDGKLVYARGFGMADIQRNKPVTPDTIFRIGSTSKTHTSIALMQLWEQGKFDLDDPINPHLKAFKVTHDDPHAPPITFRHLMTHTSGIGESRTVWDAIRWLISGKSEFMVDPDTPVVPIPEYLKGRLRAEVYPGKKWAYANHAYTTMGQLIEDISGEKFEEYMIRHVFNPLGMTSSDYLLSERVQGNLAQGYDFKKGRFEPVPYRHIIIGAAGSIFSSINDMAKYAAALMGGGENENGHILKKETLDLMFTPQLDVDARVYTIGLTFWLEKYGEHWVADHGGGLDGFLSDLRVAQRDKVAVIAFSNCNHFDPWDLCKEIMLRLINETDLSKNIPPKGVLQEPHRWPDLCGFYGPLPGFLTNFRIWRKYGGELEVYVNKQHQLCVRSLSKRFSKGIPIYKGDANDPYFYKGGPAGTSTEGIFTGLFKANLDEKVESLYVQEGWTLFKRGKTKSLRFRKNVLMGIMIALPLLLAAKIMLRKKKN